VVIQRADIFYVLGDVTKPGGFLLDRDKITVLQGLALAQGFTKTASLKNAKIIRKSGSEMVEIDLSLKSILDGKSADVALNAGDVLYVPSSFGKALWQQSTNGALGSLASAAIYVVGPKL
jgi:polysaccharide export outer membrane protein